MAEELKALLKTDDKSTVSSNQSKKLEDARKRINGICRSLVIESKSYKPEKTLKSINEYIKTPNKIDRILYSQISNYIFSLDTHMRGIFATNVDNLLLYALYEDNNVDADCRKMIIKIYDHFQLASNQIENVNNIFASSIAETKDELIKTTKGIEKEYVAILGIFAAIVLAFVGVLTFSSLVLQNIHQASIYRIVLVTSIVGIVFINVFYALFYYIDRLVKTKAEPKIRRFIIADLILVLLVVGSVLSWFGGTVEKRDAYIQNKITTTTVPVGDNSNQ